jgi:molybdopterin molybdotransferase
MDGYALRSSDTAGASAEDPRELQLAAGCAAAGHDSGHALAAGECLRILTGAPLPAAADAVVPQEEVELYGSKLILRQPVSSGAWIMPRGADVTIGEAVLAAGTVLTPTGLAMAAAMGYAGLRVGQQPRVALLGTGDELMELGEGRPGPHEYCNNRHLLEWTARLQGGIAIPLGLAMDNPDAIASCLAGVDADLVITTGGVGSGDRDFVLKAWDALGVSICLYGINLSPGRNSAFGTRGQQVFCALPGNPWAAQLVFSEMLAPLLRRWQGLMIQEPPALFACLERSIESRSSFHRAVRGVLENREGNWTFLPSRAKEASGFGQLAASPAYALVPPQAREMPPGQILRVGLLGLPLLGLATLSMSR